MSRKVRTTVTLEVRINIPPRSNAAAIQQFVGGAIQSYGCGIDPDDPLSSIKEQGPGKDFTVRLVKKETSYV